MEKQNNKYNPHEYGSEKFFFISISFLGSLFKRFYTNYKSIFKLIMMDIIIGLIKKKSIVKVAANKKVYFFTTSFASLFFHTCFFVFLFFLTLLFFLFCLLTEHELCITL